MKHKVTDRVRVKDNLLSDNTYDGLYFNSLMVDLRGKEFLIDTIDQYGYHFKDHEWAFNDAMVDLIDNSKSSRPSKSDLKRGYWTKQNNSNVFSPPQDNLGCTEIVEDKAESSPAGVKYDSGKPDLSMLPYEALEQVAKVLGFGEKKYGRAQWKKGINSTRLIAAAMRHLGQYNSGLDTDEESGESHIAHCIANLMFLIWMEKNKPEWDDRDV